MKVTVVYADTLNVIGRGELVPAADHLRFEDNAHDAVDRDAVVLLVGRERAAIVRYKVKKRVVTSYGTYVWPRFRKYGLGRRLWKEVIKRTGAQAIKLTCVTDRGMTLAKSLERSFPGVEWLIIDNGQRKLRVLRQ